MNTGTPSADVSHVPAVRRGARPPHLLSQTWWLVFTAVMAVVIYLLGVLLAAR